MSGNRSSDHEMHAPQIPRLCRYLSELSPQPMVAVDGETHVINYVNPAFTQLVGKDRKDLIDRPFTQAVPEGIENDCQVLLDRVFRTGVAENLPEQEHRQSKRNGTYWSYVMWAILGDDHRPVGVMIQITDTTETANFRRQAVEINESLIISAARQHELTEVAETLSAKLQAAIEMRDRFIAVMSHELRNPLTTLRSGLEVLKLAGSDAATVECARDMMARQLKQMVRLVDDLLDVSRITMGKLELRKEKVELSSIMHDAVVACSALIDEQGHRLTVSLPPEPILLDADAVRLTQVFSNLLNNAAKYSERGGEIRLSAVLDRSEIVVSIRDTGIGIPAAKLPNIFEAFVQVDISWERRQGGMGIGLSLVKEFVGLHGGKVEARSEGSGHGSEFIVRLPVATGLADELTPAEEKSQPPRRRILIVDDNRDAAESLAMVLKFMGHETLTAYDGQAGLAAAAEYSPDFVVMDLGMPNMDGYEACRRIRAKSRGNAPYLVALSGWGSADDQRRTHDAGFDRHMVKPIDVDVLIKMIAEISS